MLSLFLGIAVCQSESPFSGTANIKWVDKVTGGGYKGSAFWPPEMQIWRTSLAPEFLIGFLLLLSRFSRCPTLCNPIDGSPLGSPIPGILQARTLESVAISSSNAWKWKVKVKSLIHVQLFSTPWTAAYQAPPSMGFSRQEYWSGVPLPSPFGQL